MSRAEWTAIARIKSRPPSIRRVRTSAPSGVSMARATVPTGLASVPPSGPAMPVMPMPTSAPLRARMPAAIACATGSLTAPCVSRSAGSTPSRSIFDWLL